MIIGKELKQFLLSNSNNNIAKRLLELETEEAEFIQDIDFLNIAIENPSKISYFNKNRFDRLTEGSYHKEITCNEDLRGLKVTLKDESCYKYQQRGEGIISCTHVSVFESLLTSALADSTTCDSVFAVSIRWENCDSNAYRLADIEEIYVKDDKIYHSEENPNVIWNKTVRLKMAYMISPAKMVKKLNLDFCDKDIQQFNLLFFRDDVCLRVQNVYFDLVKGNAIKEAYDGDNYHDSNGTLGSSCMRSTDAQDWVQIYADYPDKISMLVLRHGDSSKVVGRAIVWKCTCTDTDTDEKIIFMDRIYSSKTTYEEFFKNYAERKGWWYKSEQTYSSPDEFRTPNDSYQTTQNYNITITLEDADDKQFPYLDTFRSGNKKGGDIVLQNNNYQSYDFTSTDGGPFRAEDMVWSEYEDRDIHEEEARYSNRLGSYIHENNAVGVEGDYMPYDHDDIVEICSTYYFKEDCTYSDHYDEYIHSDISNIIELANGDYVYEDDAVKCDYLGEYYLKDDCVFSDHEDDYILIADAVEHDELGWVLESSFEDILEERSKEEVEC